MKQNALLVLTCLWACVACYAAGPTTAPQSVPTQPSVSRPTEAATAPTQETSPEAMRILQALEEADDAYPLLRAELDYRIDMTLTGDTEARTGWVAFRSAANDVPAKFRIHFETLQQGERSKIRARVDYAFDGGQWMSEAKHRIKQLTHYQVAAKGEKVDLYRLGKGPFPMPFGQRVDDVLKYFEVTTRALRETDPKNTEYLKLVTRRNRRRETTFREMQLWVDRDTHLPVRLTTRDKSRNVTTVVFRSVRKATELEDDLFVLKRPWGWKERYMPLEKASAPGQN
jgi:hypothetical protein